MWLAAAADLVTVSTPAQERALAAIGVAAALVPLSDEANGAASTVLRELAMVPPRGQPPPLPLRLSGYVVRVFPRLRKLYVAGNWKMNLSLAEARALIEGISAKLPQPPLGQIAIAAGFRAGNRV